MEIRQRIVIGDAKTPFDEIPVTVLDINPRYLMVLIRKGVTTVRAALELAQQDDSSPLTSSLTQIVYELRQALEHQGYFNGEPFDYHHLTSFENRLAWLAQTQDAEGRWGHNPDRTIGATLSLIRAGHTSTRGEYAPVVARGVRWLEQAFAGPGAQFSDDNLSPREENLRSLRKGIPLKNSTMAYGLLCVLAENYDMPRPIAPFEPPRNTDFKSVIEARRWALLIGNAPLYGWSDGGWNTFESKEEDYDYSCYPTIEFAWMTVGAPRSITR